MVQMAYVAHYLFLVKYLRYLKLTKNISNACSNIRLAEMLKTKCLFLYNYDAHKSSISIPFIE